MNMFFNTLAITLTIVLVQGNPQKINVSVYYETLCFHSVRLVQRQLYPTWWELKDYLNITFVPYGKAVQNKNPDGKWVFDCHNGPMECYGNKIQACALNEFKNDSSLSMQYIRCFMNYNVYYPFNTTCFEDVTGDLESKRRYEKCVVSEEGNEVLALYGEMTHAVQPTFTYVPAMMFNGVYDYDLDARARRNFKNTICDLIQSPKPSAC